LYVTSFLPSAFVVAMLSAHATEQPSNQADQTEQAGLGKLGRVDFPTSCSQPTKEAAHRQTRLSQPALADVHLFATVQLPRRASHGQAGNKARATLSDNVTG
jgi:hypothetical protein